MSIERTFGKPPGAGMARLSFFVWLFVFAIATLAGSTRHEFKEKKVIVNAIINPRQYADLLNTSYLPFKLRPGAKISWPADGKMGPAERIPLQLAIKGETLLVHYGSSVDALDRGDGEVIWTRALAGNFDPDFSADGIMTINGAGIYERLGYNGTVDKRVTLPFLVGRLQLHWVDINDGEARYIFQAAPIPAHAPGEESLEAFLAYHRYAPEQENSIWLMQQSGIVRFFAIDTERKRLVFSVRGKVYVVNLEGESDKDKKMLEFGDVLGLSVTHEGNLALIDSTEKGMFIREITTDGKEIHAQMIPHSGSANYPPASAPGDHIYFMAGEFLYHLEEGKIGWELQLPPSAERFLTVLSDRTLLVASGTSLLQVNDAGKLVFHWSLPDTVTCRPIVDEQGRIFVAGRRGVVCLN